MQFLNFIDAKLIKYVCIGIFNTLVGYAIIFSCMYILGLSPVLSNSISYAIGLSLTYTLNRKLTFKSKGKVNKEVIRFLIAFVIAFSMNIIALKICIEILNIHVAISQIIASIVYVAFSFPLLKLYVYRSK